MTRASNPPPLISISGCPPPRASLVGRSLPSPSPSTSLTSCDPCFELYDKLQFRLPPPSLKTRQQSKNRSEPDGYSRYREHVKKLHTAFDGASSCWFPSVDSSGAAAPGLRLTTGGRSGNGRAPALRTLNYKWTTQMRMSVSVAK